MLKKFLLGAVLAGVLAFSANAKWSVFSEDKGYMTYQQSGILTCPDSVQVNAPTFTTGHYMIRGMQVSFHSHGDYDAHGLLARFKHWGSQGDLMWAAQETNNTNDGQHIIAAVNTPIAAAVWGYGISEVIKVTNLEYLKLYATGDTGETPKLNWSILWFFDESSIRDNTWTE